MYPKNVSGESCHYVIMTQHLNRTDSTPAAVWDDTNHVK